MLHKIIRAITVLLALALVGYIVVLKWPQASVKSKSVDIEITAQSIYEAFSNDEAAAEKQYLGKVISVSGIVDEIYEDEDGAPVVILRDAEGTPNAVVTLEPNQKNKINNYGEGQVINIKAQCSGMLMEVTFNKGIIL